MTRKKDVSPLRSRGSALFKYASVALIVFAFTLGRESTAQFIGRYLTPAVNDPSAGFTNMLVTIRPQSILGPRVTSKPPETWKAAHEICRAFGFPAETNVAGIVTTYLFSETANGIGMCCKITNQNTLCAVDDGTADGVGCTTTYDSMMSVPYSPAALSNFSHNMMGILGSYTSGVGPGPVWTSSGCRYVCGNFGSLPPCCGVPKPPTCTDTNPTPSLGAWNDCRTAWRQTTIGAPCGKGPLPATEDYLVQPNPPPISFDPHLAACYPFRITKNTPAATANTMWGFSLSPVGPSATLDTVFPGTWHTFQYYWPTPGAGFQ